MTEKPKNTCRRPLPDGGTSAYRCACHERMGNDFWFMPLERCLFEGDLDVSKEGDPGFKDSQPFPGFSELGG